MASCPCVSLLQGDSKRSCPFRLALSASSPGDFRPVIIKCLQSSLHCCRLAIGSPKWPFALRPTCRSIRQQRFLSNRVAYATPRRPFTHLSPADSAIFSQAASSQEECRRFCITLLLVKCITSVSELNCCWEFTLEQSRSLLSVCRMYMHI